MQLIQHIMNTTASDIEQEHEHTATRADSHGSDPYSIPQSETQRQLEMDFEALREREANLRQYEARLRGWQEQLDARAGNADGAGGGAVFGNSATAPAATDAELCAAWEKFHRARALLQAEQNQLRDDRMAQHDNLLELKRREEELIAREKRLAERELLLTIAVGAQEEKKHESSLQRIKSVFGTHK